ncbi:hypothetical protein AVEN_59312-1 [Araneus ventricosus]|uniref:Uncharacterized protein n=1 Tax=Araneus ventricosus TaxID=182803 RepID=A0A4Y2IRL1_ARAVE|nr:hypothetical protein AVEN_59312-1 [Araneus ventricosus]
MLLQGTGEVLCGLPGAEFDYSPSILVDYKPNGESTLPFRSIWVKLNDSRCNNSSTEAGFPAALTGQGPTPPEGGTYYGWRRGSIPPSLHPLPGARTCLHIWGFSYP